MFDSLVKNSDQELLKARLAQAEAKLRTMTVVTKQDAMAVIFSTLNQALALGNRMTPLKPIVREGPAKSGDVDQNLAILNQDATAIIQQLLDTENNAASLYNLFASTGNSLRQLIREKVYSSSKLSYLEPLITADRLASKTATIDFNPGVATLPVTSDTTVSPSSLVVGTRSVGTAADPTALPNLLDGKSETSYVWNGAVLELILSFPSPQILNYVQVEMVGYQGLSVNAFVSSPDGILIEDLLPDLPEENRSMDGSSGRFSGDWTAYFNPRHMTQLRLVVSDRVGDRRIELRNITCSQLKYSSNGTLQTVPISGPIGTVVFEADTMTANKLTSVSHQISSDGFAFTSIQPGEVLGLADSPYWYRAVLERLDSNFSQVASAVTVEDPATATTFTLSGSSTLDLGGGVIERTLNFSSLLSVTLTETPLTGTLTIFRGAVVVSGADYAFTGHALVFAMTQTGITVRYQTSAYANAGILARQAYYTPLLYGFSFTRM
jgi:hypothetical protein